MTLLLELQELKSPLQSKKERQLRCKSCERSIYMANGKVVALLMDSRTVFTL